VAGAATFQYTNDQRATALWFHDHAFGMTRANVYAGPAGFYMIRGGPDDLAAGVLPSGAYEIPLTIQDKSFNSNGSLFYPDNRAFFEGLNVPGEEPQFPGAGELRIPLAPTLTPEGQPSDIAPLHNPEFFGNTAVVNGKTWPFVNVEQRRYRIRLLNASDSRMYILNMPKGVNFWVIGADGGFLPKPVSQSQILIAPAERFDIILDFTNVPVGTKMVMTNIGPDEPFGGGTPGKDFAASNPDTTGKVMQFRVVKRVGKDTSIAPDKLALPAITPISGTPTTRYLSLNELASSTVFASFDQNGNLVFDPNGEAWAPQSARLGTLNPVTGVPTPKEFLDPTTENPAVGHTEIWEIRNFTADAHPIHIHQIQFQVISRTDVNGVTTGPEPWETGFKDTAIMYPGDEGDHPGITRVKVKFDIAGLYLWHCHILSHEDNEMMRPIQVVP
jgi:bilirubin oxidase